MATAKRTRSKRSTKKGAADQKRSAEGAGSNQIRPPLETFPNPQPRRDYRVRHVAPEFTSVCPITGQPDFGTVTIEYTPDQLCIELKSLKYYLQSFREQGIFYEAVTNLILDELVAALRPRWMRIETSWTPRGGMNSVVTAEHGTRA